VAGGRPVGRMNSASRGLRPTVGLRRPGRRLLRRRRPTPGAERLGRPISIGVKAFGRRSACADRGGVSCVGGGRRLARKRLRRPISNRRESLRRPGGCLLRRRRPTRGAERLGRPISNRREGLRRPGRCLLRRRRPTPGAERLGRPISNRREGLHRLGRCLLRRRSPTPGAERP